jgi:hypothetical protein
VHRVGLADRLRITTPASAARLRALANGTGSKVARSSRDSQSRFSSVAPIFVANAMLCGSDSLTPLRTQWGARGMRAATVSSNNAMPMPRRRAAGRTTTSRL